MKAFLTVCVLALVAVAIAVPVCDEKMIAEINNGNHGWQAGCSPRFAHMSVEEMKSKLMRLEHTHPRPRSLPSMALAAPSGGVGAIPDTFDARQQWPNCIHPIRDQQQV